ncbi:MAG: 2-aminoethylphosphonate--pyruvate transaminase [Alphaproteobacteria bacterium]|nr:2-aminoethylphosphonate--pyruvate transaminase [Alphaproteobacteria bacterium]
MPDVPLLLTPGPLSTAPAVRAAMAEDLGSRDPAFVRLSDDVRHQVAALAGSSDELVCIPVQGGGTFAIEAVLGTLVPRSGKVLVLVNGAYGRRIVQICHTLGREVTWLEWPEDSPFDPAEVDRALGNDEAITHVAAVYCETTTGLLNPLAALAAVVADHGISLLVDAVSAFGALPLSIDTVPFDAAVTASHGCLESVPGIGLAIVRRTALARCGGHAHSVALDLHAQQKRFEKDGQWRFTPPTQAVAALHAALQGLADEGGVDARGSRYAATCAALVKGMRAQGFRTVLSDAHQAPVVVSFHVPGAASWSYDAFHDGLRQAGFAIHPGRITEVDAFRVGCIGQVDLADIARFLAAVAGVLTDMGVASGAPSSTTSSG